MAVREDERCLFFMRMALQQAEQALTRGEVPVGCVFVKREPAAREASSQAAETGVHGNMQQPVSAASDQQPQTAVVHCSQEAHAAVGQPGQTITADPAIAQRYESAVIATGHNETNLTRNATRHAELVAIDKALQAAGDCSSTVLEGCDLFVTCEPCIMCAAALSNIRVGRVYFGCHNEKFGGCGSIVSVHSGSHMGPTAGTYEVHPGLLKDEAVALFRRFYSRENGKAPEPKRRKK